MSSQVLLGYWLHRSCKQKLFTEKGNEILKADPSLELSSVL